MMGGTDIAVVDEANPGDPRGAAAAAATATGASSMIDPGAAGADAEAATIVSEAEAPPSAETSSCSTTPVTGSRQTSFPMKSLQTLELPQSAKQIRFLNINEK